MSPKSDRFIGSNGTNHLPRRRKRFRTNEWMSVPANHACITRIAWTTGGHGHADTEPGAGSRQIYHGTAFMHQIWPGLWVHFPDPNITPNKHRARRRFEKQYTGKLIALKKWPAMWVQFPDPIITPTSINARTVGLQAFEADFGGGFRTHFSTLVRGTLMSKSEGLMYEESLNHISRFATRTASHAHFIAWRNENASSHPFKIQRKKWSNFCKN